MTPDPRTRRTKARDAERGGTGVLFLVPLLVLVFGAALYLYTTPSGPEATDAASNATGAGDLAVMQQSTYMAGQKRCEFFVVQKILSAREPTVLDHWEKDGKRVFQMGFTRSGEPGQSVRLCVYDPERRSALLPAVDDQDQWRP